MKLDLTPTILVSPISRAPLFRCDGLLSTADNLESFSIENDILLLLQQDTANEALRHEIDIFDNLPVQGVSYFRSSLYLQMINKLTTYLPHTTMEGNSVFRFAELGGGEGHCARRIAEHFDGAEVYVCDLSRKALGHAPSPLQRLCADITRPLFAPESLDAAAFWVSLHHIPHDQRRLALQEAYLALKEGGILLLFEPNNAFFVRRMLYHSSCRHDIYFDEQESAIDFLEIIAMAEEVGFNELGTTYLNPPYNPAFVRQLKRWWLYLPVVELSYQAGKLMSCQQSGKYDSRVRYASLYGLSFLQKTARNTGAICQ